MNALEIVIASLREMARNLLAALPELMVAMIVLVLTWVLTRAVDRALAPFAERIRLRDSLIELFRKAPHSHHLDHGNRHRRGDRDTGLQRIECPGGAWTRLGGDCAGHEGVVEKITIRDTHIRQGDMQRVVMPNATLFKEPVIVRTDLQHRRVTVRCGIAYDADIANARQVILGAITDLPSIIQEMPILVTAAEFADSSITMEITWSSVSTPVDVRKSKDEVITAVRSALDSAGIEIPFPQRVITMRGRLDGGAATSRITPVETNRETPA